MHKFRQMKQADVPAVLHVQHDCYEPMTLEDEPTIRHRLETAPDSAWVVEDAEGVCAYLVAYRSVVGKVTPLGGLFEVPANANSLYLHDLAVSTRAKGFRLGPVLVQHACTTARQDGLVYSSLVSVQGSREFWQRLGYNEWTALTAVQSANLKTYAGVACYMVRKLV